MNCHNRDVANRSVWVDLILQTLLIGCALLLALWVPLPWPAKVAAALTGVSLAAARLARNAGGRLGLAAVWILSLLVFASVRTTDIWDAYYAAPAWLIAAAIWLTSRRVAEAPARGRWQMLVMVWSFLGGIICLADGYSQNTPGPFYVGLLATVAFLILCRLWFRMAPAGAQVVNTLVLLLIGLPVVDFVVRPPDRLDLQPETWRNYYSYQGARGNPARFARWFQYFQDEVDLLQRDIFQQIPGGQPSCRLRPNSHGMLFRSQVFINSKGFRGREIPVKGETYRIVALGESTTFGLTLHPQDKPWPELLEQIIRQRLKPWRPVEVINAGVIAYSITENVSRLGREILPLQPDMIISYHGFNGFGLIDPVLPPPAGPPPPIYRQRPFKLAADCEYKLKLMLFRHGYIREVPLRRRAPPKPLDTTRYAGPYQQLIRFAQTNRIRLVLANFSMSVNRNSDPEVIEFYRSVFPDIYGFIKANEVHTALVEQLAAPYPEVCLADTHSGLDGEHDKFIDLVHLTQAGRQQLAENMFAGIRQVLENDLSQPP